MSVRGITDEDGRLTDTLVFDAFGNEVERTGTTENSYGFQGEEQDETGLYYLRARYMDPTTGTFTSMDTYGGSLSDPMSLHKYLFANSNPVKWCDPSGHSASLEEFALAMGMQAIIGAELNGIFYVFGLKCGEISQPCNNTFFYFDLADQMFKGALLGVIFTAMYMITSVFLVTRIVSYVLLIVGGLNTWSNASDDLWSGNLDRQQIGMLEFALGTFMIGSGVFGLGKEFGSANVSEVNGSENTENPVNDSAIPENTVRVGRWMSVEEYNAMIETGRVQQARGNMQGTHVSIPPDISSFTNPRPGSIYVEFSVDSSRITNGGKPDWFIVTAPGSYVDKLNQIRGGEPLTDMPLAFDITVIYEG